MDEGKGPTGALAGVLATAAEEDASVSIAAKFTTTPCPALHTAGNLGITALFLP